MATESKNILKSGTATECTYLDTTRFQTTWNNHGWLVITRFVTIDYTQKVQSIKQDDDSQERMERRPLGLLQARLQSMVLVAPLAGETLSIFGFAFWIWILAFAFWICIFGFASSIQLYIKMAWGLPPRWEGSLWWLLQPQLWRVCPWQECWGIWLAWRDSCHWVACWILSGNNQMSPESIAHQYNNSTTTNKIPKKIGIWAPI